MYNEQYRNSKHSRNRGHSVLIYAAAQKFDRQ